MSNTTAETKALPQVGDVVDVRARRHQVLAFTTQSKGNLVGLALGCNSEVGHSWLALSWFTPTSKHRGGLSAFMRGFGPEGPRIYTTKWDVTWPHVFT